MTLESNSVNQTPVEVESSETEDEEEVEKPKGRKKRSLVWINFDEVKLKKDNDWNLVKKVLNFCRLDGHRGIDIGKGVENCLNEWGFNNILSISVDNASSNDTAISFIKMIFEKNHDCKSIESIRCAVKWIKKSGTRIKMFDKCARSARCDSTKSLVLDVPTRWNSTYNMLEVAHEYKDALARYDLEDVYFGLHIRNKGHSVPTSEDWVNAKKLCHSLKTFYDITLRISETKYVTSHTLVNELATIRNLLRTQLDCDIHGEPPMDKHLYDIANAMKPKFGKYYGEVENMNLLVYFAFILDPRNKYEFLDLLYEDYVRIHAPSSDSSSTLGKRPRTTNTSNELDHGDMLRRRMKTGQSSSSSTSELDKYNGEFCEPFDKNVHFDILQWWKVNSQRFPILSLMARDLLAIPISTVASESVFSTSGRVLDSYRSSLGDKTVECLVCAQDWLRISLNPKKEEDMDTIAKIEKELMEQEGARLND
ncbi:zinc finger BED domain-containing protein RICESLEEPER 2-like protein, partial [Tanacetum coccineum]